MGGVRRPRGRSPVAAPALIIPGPASGGASIIGAAAANPAIGAVLPGTTGPPPPPPGSLEGGGVDGGRGRGVGGGVEGGWGLGADVPPLVAPDRYVPFAEASAPAEVAFWA